MIEMSFGGKRNQSMGNSVSCLHLVNLIQPGKREPREELPPPD